MIGRGLSVALIGLRLLSIVPASEAVRVVRARPALRLHARGLATGAAPKADRAAAADGPAAQVRFAELPLLPGTQAALAREFGYELCSPVQAAAIPVALSGKDVLARAQTGTGKTLAFLIPAVERIARARVAAPTGCASVLVLSPTRELTEQIAREADRLCTSLIPPITIQSMIGGASVEPERVRINKRGLGDVLVATPGRLIDHLQNTPGFAKRLAHVHTLVLDEADQLLDMGFKPSVEKILRQLPPASSRQTLLFSATLSDSIKQIAKMAMRAGDATQVVDCVGAGAQDATAALLEQRWLSCAQEELLPTLWAAIGAAEAASLGKTIVFCPTARLTQLLAEVAREGGLAGVLEIHSRKSQPYRTKVSDQFRSAKAGVLFTSDVSARGVDYPDVGLVVQVGVPPTREQYVHRTGRSARGGKGGAGLLLLCDYELPFLDELTGLPISKLTPADAYFVKATAQPSAALGAALERVRDGGGARDDLVGDVYRSWFGYYRSFAKKFGWAPEDLVATGNRFANHLGCADPPMLSSSLLGKLGLKGVSGLRVEPKALTSAKRAATASAQRGGGGGGRSAPRADEARAPMAREAARFEDAPRAARAARSEDSPRAAREAPRYGDTPRAPREASRYGDTPRPAREAPRYGDTPRAPRETTRYGDSAPRAARSEDSPRAPREAPRYGESPRAAREAPRYGDTPRPAREAPRYGESPRAAREAPRYGDTPRPAREAPRYGDTPRAPREAPRYGESPRAPREAPRYGESPRAARDAPRETARYGDAPRAPREAPRYGDTARATRAPDGRDSAPSTRGNFVDRTTGVGSAAGRPARGSREDSAAPRAERREPTRGGSGAYRDASSAPPPRGGARRPGPPR